MQIGYIGLGRMGKNMVFHLLEQGIKVVAWNRSPEPREEVKKAGAVACETIEELVSKLKTPRIIWIMVSAGEIVDEMIDALIPHLSKGDLVIDGGNSFYKDSIKRGQKLSTKGIHFMDIGTSGGPGGARSGACLMIGGAKEDYEKIKKLAKAAASQDAYQHLGPIGAGHFAKMVHNAIEYGMMESIGEGLSILKFSPFKYDFNKVLDIYMHRSVVESRLVNWAWDAFKEDPNLSDTSSSIGSGGSGKRVLGEADWTVNIAKEWGIDVPAMKSSIKVRENSHKDPENSPEGFRNKVISGMRGQFGQHAVKKSR